MGLALGLFSACGELSEPTGSNGNDPHVTTGSAALSSADGDQCATLTAATIQQALDAVGASLAAAVIDNDLHGSSGPYPRMAQYNLQFVQAAYTIIADLQEWLAGPASDGKPSITNYVEGSAIQTNMGRAIGSLLEARFYAINSAVYNDSYPSDPSGVSYARRSLEQNFLAVEILNDIAARGGRCNMDTYKIIIAPAL